MKLLILLLLASCASQIKTKTSSHHYRIDTIQTGVTCPVGYYYSFKDELCHTSRVDNPKPLKRKIKANRPLKIDCGNVFKVVNQCMGAK